MKIPSWIRRIDDPDRKITLEEHDAILDQRDEALVKADGIRKELEAAREENVKLLEKLQKILSHLDRDIPSILEQTAWPCGFFDFGKAKNPDVRYFNCGLIRKPDGLWLVTRRSHNVSSWPRLEVGMNDIVAFKLSEDMRPQFGNKVVFPRSLAEQHHEDPRVVKMGNNYFVSATTFQVNKQRNGWTGAHQQIGRVNDNWAVDYLADPIYGKNGGSPLMNTGNEKNWLWFEHDGKPHLFYTTGWRENKTVVVQFRENLVEPEVEYVSGNEKCIWNSGEPRGGTPPVRVGDEYFTFFHSSTAWTAKKNRYHMGALAFRAKPPFEITRMSSIPILSGSKNDEWHDGLPLVVFPCGAVLEGEIWTVTMGVNDCCSAWIKIPHRDLLSILRPSDECFETVQPETETTLVENPAEHAGTTVAPDTSRQAGGGNGDAVAQPLHDAHGFRHAPKRVARKNKRDRKGS